ncbi:hypothetical protein [Yeosuana marina]|uniref:hypothetical protein n=1 Tax=Yeosuana marina TaxID=1565536 RepID=UPI0014224ADC|nr:hypothetical protein [Yeosuana marina]
MKKEFIIKKSPLLKIVLNKTEFKIINHQYKQESGVFSYSKLYDIEFKEKSIDIFGTIAVFILSIFLPGPKSGIFKIKERIRMNYDGVERIFILFNFDKNTVKEAIAEIEKHITEK